jgi:hypothetical protein
MKNLTSSLINLAIGESRVQLPAPEVVPKLIVGIPTLIGVLPPHHVEIVQQARTTIDFTGINLCQEDQPFIVSREIFDALPADRIEFVTPDYDTAIMNGLGIPHVVRRLISKQGPVTIVNDMAVQFKAA